MTAVLLVENLEESLVTDIINQKKISNEVFTVWLVNTFKVIGVYLQQVAKSFCISDSHI